MKPLLAPMKCSTSTIGRLVAIAPRVAKITDSTVAASIRMSNADAADDRGLRHGAHAVDPGAVIVEAGAGDLLGQRLLQRREIDAAGRRSFTTIIRGTGRSSSERPLPSHGSSSRADSSLE